MRSILALVVCAALIGAIMAGCGRKQTVQTPGGEVTVKDGPGKTEVTFEGEEGEGKVEIKGDEMSGTITTEEGTVQFGAAAQVSEDDLGMPIYPGAETQHTGKFSQQDEEEGKLVRASFTTPESADKVKAFYQEKVAGARVAMDISSADSRMVQMVVEEEGLQKSIIITRAKDDDETQITLMRVEEGD